MATKKRALKLVSAGLIFIPAVLIFIKINYFKFQVRDLMPDKAYKLSLQMNIKASGQDNFYINTFLPLNTIKQNVTSEKIASKIFSNKIEQQKLNRILHLKADNIRKSAKIIYSSIIKSQRIKFDFTKDTKLLPIEDKSILVYLENEKLIQTDSKLIKDALAKIIDGKKSLYDKLKAIHNFIVKEIEYKNFAGGLDAETSLRLLEASCNGKSRLYVAMARIMGLPARLVGGIILNHSPKKVIHQWVEIYINGYWVPFGPTNNHFATLPAKYITLYIGDEVLFNRSANMKFDYYYKYETTNTPSSNIETKYQNFPLSLISLISQFKKFNISLNVLIYLLMLPIATFVTVIFRNIFGLETFGTFLPVLVASVLSNSGLLIGLTLFFSVIFIVYYLNTLLGKAGILYHPKMAILLSTVIIFYILVFYLGLQWNNYRLVNIVFFPVAITAITINRVTSLMEEYNFMKIIKVTLGTILVISLAYMFIHSISLRYLMLYFPELVLLIIGLNIFTGRWQGLRISEYIRFKGLIQK